MKIRLGNTDNNGEFPEVYPGDIVSILDEEDDSSSYYLVVLLKGNKHLVNICDGVFWSWDELWGFLNPHQVTKVNNAFLTVGE